MGPNAALQQEQREAAPPRGDMTVDACSLSCEELVTWCRDGQQQQTPSGPPSSSSSIFHPELRQFAVRRRGVPAIALCKTSPVWQNNQHFSEAGVALPATIAP